MNTKKSKKVIQSGIYHGSVFQLNSSSPIGRVYEVSSHKVSVSNDNKQEIQVGQIVAIDIMNQSGYWLIGIIENMIIKPIEKQREVQPYSSIGIPDNEDIKEEEQIFNIILLGTVYRDDSMDMKPQFSRTLFQLPSINAKCYVLRDTQLESFMNILSDESSKGYSLELGKYTFAKSAKAYLDGNKFFQRHAAIFGSTGSGKSWTVATILEQAAELPSSNLIVFDLHGEYQKLSYVKYIRIPGTDDMGSYSDGLLYLPYWLLNIDDILTMFVDLNEFSAQNQIATLRELIVEEKKRTLRYLKKFDILNAFTIDSPIPFSLDVIIEKLENLNEEMIQSSRGLKHGKYYGQFNQLLSRLRSKLNDNRYGFLFHAPDSEHQYESMARLANTLMNSFMHAKIKVIDFSEVPADILPLTIGLVARIIYNVQFWTDMQKRHPLVLVCDEAHLYLSEKEEIYSSKKSSLDVFEKIAKEGRKYGIAALIVSQRPSDVSSTILSQCNNIIALRLMDEKDQDAIRMLMPESLLSLLESLPILDIGEAVVIGDAVLLPNRIKIRKPQEEPLSATMDFWSEWTQQPPIPDFENAVENMRKQSRGRYS